MRKGFSVKRSSRTLHFFLRKPPQSLLHGRTTAQNTNVHLTLVGQNIKKLMLLAYILWQEVLHYPDFRRLIFPCPKCNMLAVRMNT